MSNLLKDVLNALPSMFDIEARPVSSGPVMREMAEKYHRQNDPENMAGDFRTVGQYIRQACDTYARQVAQ
ncbi:MAG: hypothetical protein K2O70_06710 [Desulfovibrionaceae bacterium]|nr:hypothetical protein [Desulfovibrionaceae bacterium]